MLELDGEGDAAKVTIFFDREGKRKLMAKYERAAEDLVEWRVYRMADAEVALIGYGIVGRVLRSAVDLARERGIRAGLIRPVTLWPFPADFIGRESERLSEILVVELSDGQMVEDVRNAVRGRCPVHFHGRQGGMVPSPGEVLDELCARMSIPGKDHEHACSL